ncbi:hypothetical protein SAMN02745166_03495 [Prosthecobacter debontii]|uniref:Uncharacterized protein n=1 Tax=Prosthecobacter debontii TaxID=48467 RepID=A0A1T4YJ67_9BACT|nr:hypothetical protein [Prosthecobacter debontii]SKB01887.1 hypothetical protein SAMN02745166_03495 [Prosthecobacter debontii]
MLENDEQEFWRLQTAISQVEALIANGAIASNSMLNKLLSIADDSKKRIAQLEQSDELRPADEKKQRTVELALVKYLVEKETALNAAERGQYESFLSREFFTKDDFSSLESFYANTWDKLTETGKAQMSHRVWEGVRRDEYDFSELPETVREKEAQRVRDMFSALKDMPPEMRNIPAADRDDFIKAWDSGRKREAYSVLDRTSFKDNVAVTPREVTEAHAVESSKLDTKAITKSEDKPIEKAEAIQLAGMVDLAAVDISLGSEDSKAISPARLSEPKTEKKLELGGS